MAVAFCDITGRESRLPLSLYGTGIGLRLELSYDNLDIGNIFVGSEHSYEVVLANKGFIGASFRFLPSTSTFGRCVQFVPSKNSIAAEQLQAVSINICETLGNFEEQFHVEIIGLQEKLRLTIRGSVIRPALDVDIPKLKFGHVAYGFTSTMTCRLLNTSLIPVHFKIYVPGDGDKPVVCNDDFYRRKLDPSLAKKSLVMQPLFSSGEEMATSKGQVAQSVNADASCNNSNLPEKITDIFTAYEKEFNWNTNCSLSGNGQPTAAKENCQQEGSCLGNEQGCDQKIDCSPCNKAFVRERKNKCKCNQKVTKDQVCCLDPCCKVDVKLLNGKFNQFSDCGDRNCLEKECQFISKFCEDKEVCSPKEVRRTPVGCCLGCGEPGIKVGDACIKCGGTELLMQNPSAADVIPLADSEVNAKNAEKTQSKAARPPKEFNIEPAEGILHPKSEVEVSVGLCSNTVSKYLNMLTVDLIDMEVAVLTIPLSARCIVPPVNLLAPSADLGRCFLRYPYQLVIQLENDSDLPAKYNVLSQQNSEDESIHYAATDPVGIVLGESVEDIPLTIYPQRLGICEVNVPVVLDGQTVPLLFKVTCRGEGPVLMVKPSCLDWSKIPVLCKVEKTITLSNESPIPAKFSTSLRRDDSVWTLDAEEGEIEPEESCEFSITAFFNDTLRFTDDLIISVTDGIIHKIKLTGCGYGSTIVITPSMRGCVQLGPCFSGTSTEKTYTITNYGRRIQSIYWQTDEFPLFSRSTHWKKHGKMDDNAPLIPVFRINPLRSELWPGESTTMSLQAHYDSPALVEETVKCYSVVDKIPYNRDPILTTRVSCNFIAPLVSFSECSLCYVLDGTRREGLCKQKKQIQMTNESSLPLTLRLKLAYPFQMCSDRSGLEICQMEFRLQVCETATVSIIFDPFFGNDLESRMAEGTLEIRYKEHPHMDKITLKGEVHYPNLSFEWISIDFGCIINDTEATRYVTMTNTSMLTVRYKWMFVANEKLPVEASEADLTLKTRLGNTKGLFDVKSPSWWCLTPNDPFEIESQMGSRYGNQYSEAIMQEMINPALVAMLIQSDPRLAPPGSEEIFDIFPLFGTLQPGCSEKVTFTFYGHAFLSSETVAVCEVDGGPKYEIDLKGQASVVQYRFNSSYINFGHIIYNQVAEGEVVLMNTGLVGFSFKVVGMDPTMDPSNSPGRALVIPHTGFVAPSTEIVLKVQYLPHSPNHFFSSFSVQVAHFDPVTIEYFGESLFPSIILKCPRFPFMEDEYDRLLCEAKEHVFSVRHIQAQVLEAFELDAEYDEAIKSQMEEFFRSQNLTCNALKHRGSIEKFIDTFISPGELMELDLEVQHEVNHLVVKNFFESQFLMTSEENTNSSNVSGTMLQSKLCNGQKLASLSQLVLPGYLIDFGPVLSGLIKTHATYIINTGLLPVSFSIDQSSAKGTGFCINLDQVSELPGQESVELVAMFNSKAVTAKVTRKVNTQLLIHIKNGPVVPFDLMATVVLPSMSVSSTFIDFGAVKCGECCIVSIQLHNNEPIVCNWEMKRPKSQTADAMLSFLSMPESGSLQPGEKRNIQIKFEPTEEKAYKSRVEFVLAQSTNLVSILCMGQGLLPRIEFNKSLVEFTPIVPFGFCECDVSVKNPCTFPVEIYSLEFDTLYLDEEKILRLMKGYDSCRNIYLPPRSAGERLPQELLDSFEEHLQKMERLQQQQQLSPSQDEEEQGKSEEEKSASESQLKGLGVVTGMAAKQTEVMPVAAAVARHIGISFQPENKAAKNRYKIGIILHGPPVSGKTLQTNSNAHDLDSCLFSSS